MKEYVTTIQVIGMITFQHNKFKKLPEAVLDIACIQKGQVYLGIEINHTHRVPDRKIELLTNLGLQELIEINASWVMNLLKKNRPAKI